MFSQIIRELETLVKHTGHTSSSFDRARIMGAMYPLFSQSRVLENHFMYYYHKRRLPEFRNRDEVTIDTPDGPKTIDKSQENYDIGMALFQKKAVSTYERVLSSAVEKIQYYEVSESALYDLFKDMIDNVLLREACMLFCGIIGSREWCHLALSKNIFTLMYANVRLFDSNGGMPAWFAKALCNGLQYLYTEELILRYNVTIEHRHVIDLDLAAILPVYDGPISTNPYICIQMMPTLINKLDDIALPPSTNRGFYNTFEFKERFELFSDGLLDGINMDKLWISGSTITACAVKSPLESLFDSTEDYFDEYYPSRKILSANAASSYDKDGFSDIDIIVHVSDIDEFEYHVQRIYKHVITILSKRYGREPTSSEVRLDRKFTNIAYKYSLCGSGIIRPFEIFRVSESTPIGAVSRFHMPAVRGVFNGSRVFILPSLLSYGMTGIFMDYRWIACSKDTRDIIINYYIRGGRLLLNGDERIDMMAYVTQSSKWSSLLKRGLASLWHNHKDDINAPVYKPRLYSHGQHAGLAEFNDRNPDRYNYIPISLTNELLPVKPSMELRDASGAINPLQMWQIDEEFKNYYQ